MHWCNVSLYQATLVGRLPRPQDRSLQRSIASFEVSTHQGYIHLLPERVGKMLYGSQHQPPPETTRLGHEDSFSHMIVAISWLWYQWYVTIRILRDPLLPVTSIAMTYNSVKRSETARPSGYIHTQKMCQIQLDLICYPVGGLRWHRRIFVDAAQSLCWPGTYIVARNMQCCQKSKTKLSFTPSITGKPATKSGLTPGSKRA